MKILNLYAGIGGNRKLWSEEHKITAVEINDKVADVYKDNFPNDKVIVADAHQYLLDHYKEFDFIWASPPCQTHTKLVKFTRHEINIYPDLNLYQEIIFLENFFEGKWVVENVEPYYTPLMPAKNKVDRHLFWANFNIGNFSPPKFLGKKLKSYKGELQSYYGFSLPEKNIYFEGSHDQYKILKNCVHPKTGEYILNCAMGVIYSNNLKQIDLFDNEKSGESR